ncbi:hypothetical protein [Streptomyces sp. MS2.AVA.5]|uniref:Uncharacterized protein n=1 Tax=Streptomyces achmelvichensis TaxID=3134111 RepID=A0ACC6Q8U2_9ACTN
MSSKPAPAERDLPGGRHHCLQDYVMREIQQIAVNAEAKQSTTGWLSSSRRSGRQLFGPGLALPAGLAAAAAGIALTAAGPDNGRLELLTK